MLLNISKITVDSHKFITRWYETFNQITCTKKSYQTTTHSQSSAWTHHMMHIQYTQFEALIANYTIICG